MGFLNTTLRKLLGSIFINSSLGKNIQRVENILTTVFVPNIRVAIIKFGLLQFRQKQCLVLQIGRAL